MNMVWNSIDLINSLGIPRMAIFGFGCECHDLNDFELGIFDIPYIYYKLEVIIKFFWYKINNLI